MPGPGADVGVVAGIGRVEEEEGVRPVELVDDLLVVGVAYPHLAQAWGVALQLVDEAGLHADVLVGHRSAPKLVERESRQVGEAVEALEVVVGNRGLLELAKVSLVADPFLAPQRGDLLGRDRLGELEGERDLGVEVRDHLHLGWVLGEQDLPAAGEGLDVDPVLGDLGDDPTRQVGLAHRRAPDVLLEDVGPEQGQHLSGAGEGLLEVSHRGGPPGRCPSSHRRVGC